MSKHLKYFYRGMKDPVSWIVPVVFLLTASLGETRQWIIKLSNAILLNPEVIQLFICIVPWFLLAYVFGRCNKE